jgi:hypothetical protein
VTVPISTGSPQVTGKGRHGVGHNMIKPTALVLATPAMVWAIRRATAYQQPRSAGTQKVDGRDAPSRKCLVGWRFGIPLTAALVVGLSLPGCSGGSDDGRAAYEAEKRFGTEAASPGTEAQPLAPADIALVGSCLKRFIVDNGDRIRAEVGGTRFDLSAASVQGRPEQLGSGTWLLGKWAVEGDSGSCTAILVGSASEIHSTRLIVHLRRRGSLYTVTEWCTQHAEVDRKNGIF